MTPREEAQVLQTLTNLTTQMRNIVGIIDDVRKGNHELLLKWDNLEVRIAKMELESLKVTGEHSKAEPSTSDNIADAADTSVAEEVKPATNKRKKKTSE